MIKLNKKGFTLAEMMVVLLIVSIVMVASVPILTKRSKTTQGIWKYASNNADIYFGLGSNQGVVIGDSKFQTGDNTARLLLKQGASSQDYILFKDSSGNSLGTLNITSDMSTGSGVGLGSGASTPQITNTFHYWTAVGSGITVGGNYNTLIGYQATNLGNYLYTTALGASTQATGSSTALGYNAVAGSISPVASNATAVGASAKATGKYSIAIGSGNISPTATADGSGAIGVDHLGNGASSSIQDQITIGTSSHTIYIPGTLSAPNTDLTVKSLKFSSTTLSGTASSSTKVLYMDDSGRIAAATVGSIAVYAITSDSRLKNINGEFSDGLDKIRQIKPVNYQLKSDKKKDPRVGVIAQDLQKVFPNAVKKGDDGYLSIRQEDMFYAMLNSIKQLDNMFKDLSDKVQALVKKVETIDKTISEIFEKNQQLISRIKDLEIKNASLEKRVKVLESHLK